MSHLQTNGSDWIKLTFGRSPLFWRQICGLLLHPNKQFIQTPNRIARGYLCRQRNQCKFLLNCIYIPIRPSWSLTRRLGVGDLSDVRTITYLIAYPYAWTVNFEHCIEVQLTTHQPQIPNFSQVYRTLNGVIGISDIEWAKRKDPLLDSWQFFEGWRAEQFP